MLPWFLQGSLSLHLSGFITVLFESWTWHMGHNTSPALGCAAAAVGVCRTCSGTTVGQCLALLLTTFDQCATTDNVATVNNAACPSCQAKFVCPGGSSGPGAGAALLLGCIQEHQCLLKAVQELALPLTAAQLSRTGACGAPAPCSVLCCGYFWVEARGQFGFLFLQSFLL